MKKIVPIILMFFCTAAFAQIKYVAVIETQIDAESGVDKEINQAELREITAEIRRIAVNTLPRGIYNVMTSETVLSMGGAVLEECAEENCVIALGSKIGADYIVRGTISKFRQNFSLSVEIFETDNGMLVASAAPVRTANLDEFLEKVAGVCEEMYKKFLGSAVQQTKPQTAVAPPPPRTYALTVNAYPPAGGQVKRDTIASRYETGTKVTAAAVPAAGYRFAGWSGASFSTKDTITVTINTDLTLNANFKSVPTYALTVNTSPPAGGLVQRTPALSRYETGTEVTIAAVPSTGYYFAGWSGASSSKEDSVTLTMNADKMLNARFKTITPPKPEKTARQKTVLKLRWSGATLATFGFIGGLIVNDAAASELETYKKADNPADANAGREKTQSLLTTRNVFYTIGGIGLGGSTVTLFF